MRHNKGVIVVCMGIVLFVAGVSIGALVWREPSIECAPPLSTEYVCKIDFQTYDQLHCFRYFDETDNRWFVIANDDVVKMIKYSSDRKVGLLFDNQP